MEALIIQGREGQRILPELVYLVVSHCSSRGVCNEATPCLSETKLGKPALGLLYAPS
jgi:hypothetical protein